MFFGLAGKQSTVPVNAAPVVESSRLSLWVEPVGILHCIKSEGGIVVCATGTEADGQAVDEEWLVRRCYQAYQAEGFENAANILESGSLIILNQVQGVLYVSRDWIGHHPVFYAIKEEGLATAFSDDRSALLSWLEQPEFDMEAVRAHLIHGHRHGSRTLFKNLFLIPPGFFVQIAIPKGTELSGIRLRRWYNPSLRTTHRTYGSTLGEFRRHLDDAIKRRMSSEGDNVLMLSSGSDSTLLLDRLTAIAGRPPRTITYAVAGSEQNELPLARTIAATYRADHTEVVLDPSTCRVEDLLHALYSPYIPLSAVNTAVEWGPVLRTLRPSLPPATVIFWGYEHGFHTPDLRWQELLAYPVYAHAKPLWRLVSRLPRIGKKAAPDLSYIFSPALSQYSARSTPEELAVQTSSAKAWLQKASNLGEVWNIKHFFRDLGMAETMMLAHRVIAQPYTVAFPYHDKTFMEFNASVPFGQRFKMDLRSLLRTGMIDSKHLVLEAVERELPLPRKGLVGNNRTGGYGLLWPVACNSSFGKAIAGVLSDLRFDRTGKQDDIVQWFIANQGKFATIGNDVQLSIQLRQLSQAVKLAAIELTHRMFVENRYFF